MAVTDIAEDDLDEMLREEAEDVFFEEGRFPKGQLYMEWKQKLVYRWAARASQGGQAGCFVTWSVIRVKKGVRVMAEGWPRGISSAVWVGWVE